MIAGGVRKKAAWIEAMPFGGAMREGLKFCIFIICSQKKRVFI